MASAKQGTVGIIGLGIMGGAFAQNLTASGWHVIGYDVAADAAAGARQAGVEIAEDAVDVARKSRIVLTSLPKPQALAETATAIAKSRDLAKLPRRVIVEMSTFTLEDKTRAEAVLRKAGHVMLDCPVSGTGAQAKVKDLVVYASGDAAEIKKLRPDVCGLYPRGAQRRRVRQRQPHEICRQPPGRDPQRGERRGHGARHESGPAAATDLRSGDGRRRQFARSSNCARR